jgi:hypothetical protein
MPDSDTFSMKETLARLEGKVDGLAASMAAIQVNKATEHAELFARLNSLEKIADRRWSLIPTWVASGLAVILALVPYLH